MDILAPRMILRAEGVILLASTVALYGRAEESWWLFALLFFVPDLSMVGYAAGSRTGAMVYNAFHTSAVAIVLAVMGVIGDQEMLTAVGLVWLAHIGFDRVLGYGLKYPEGFKETHLQRV